MMEGLQTYKVICEGGLDSNQNYLQLSDRKPGGATKLINFEPSLYGGYRRLEGFTPLEPTNPEVNSAGSEGKIFGVYVFKNNIYATRKTKLVSEYEHYKYNAGGAWIVQTSPLTFNSLNVDKVRNITYNFDGTERVLFVDGVNEPYIWDNTNWSSVKDTGTGANLANAGGNQALKNPKYVTLFKNHVFVAGDSTNPQIIAHSAPLKDYDWTVASGAGQLNAGFDIVQIKPFRDELFIFGATKIKKIVLENTTFVLKDVTWNVGCIAADSVIEINGDLLFLAQDGFRTVAATQRNNDIELGVMSKDIQQDVTELMRGADLSQVNAVVIRKKSQVRFFFSDENAEAVYNKGILGGLTGSPDGIRWEWGLIQGIRTSCVMSTYIGTDEFVLHGDYNGVVYRQEKGNSFNGANITAVYSTPYLDLGDVFVRKTMHKVQIFIKPEDQLSVSMNMQFDWDSRTVYNPTTYVYEQAPTGSLYNSVNWDAFTYASNPVPFDFKTVHGSGFSTRLTFTSSDTNGPYSIQGIVFEFSVNGRK